MGFEAKDILSENKEAVSAAGKQLAEIGKELASGKIKEALARAEAAKQKYREWEELDRATAGVEAVIREREGMVAVQNLIVELAKAVTSTAVRAAIRSL